MKRTLYAFLFALFFAQNLFSFVDRITNTNPILNELSDKTYLYEVMKYLYRWYLDDEDIKKCLESKNIIFLVRELRYNLDKDDKSLFAEMLIPVFGVALKLKKSNYLIEEQGIYIKSNVFKIVSISRISIKNVDFKQYNKTEIDLGALIKYLTQTRTHSTFPNEEVLSNIKHRLKEQVESAGKSDAFKIDPEVNDIFYLAPLSPVCNEIWLYWVGAKIIIHCKSGIDIDTPAAWDSGSLHFSLFDAYNNTLISLGQTALSNEFMTIHQVGRTLYNCMVLGKRISSESIK